jgi:predicted RNase H-like nuclease (RuvC/YqgF family)
MTRTQKARDLAKHSQSQKSSSLVEAQRQLSKEILNAGEIPNQLAQAMMPLISATETQMKAMKSSMKYHAQQNQKMTAEAAKVTKAIQEQNKNLNTEVSRLQRQVTSLEKTLDATREQLREVQSPVTMTLAASLLPVLAVAALAWRAGLLQ